MQRAHAALERQFPERRLFLKSDEGTRYVRLTPETQLLAWTGAGATVAWTVVATSILLMDTIGAGNYRDQAQRDRTIYEDRLNALSAERDQRAAEASAAQERFAAALQQISAMQSELLDSEEARLELETGLEVVHATLRRTMEDRDAAQTELAALLDEEDLPGIDPAELARTIDFVTQALADTAAERDNLFGEAQEATRLAGDLDLEMRLNEERNDEIFQQLEDALQISVEPLDNMFRAAGLDPDELIEGVREGYAGQGGPLTPIQMSTMGDAAHDDGTLRANQILDQLDRINLYRIATQRVPLTVPVVDSFRWTSGFGPRWGRMHEGVDLAGPIGTPVLTTADGVVTFAGWASGYGRLIKIQHDFGIETRYGHLNAIRVEVGQRVSRGDRIGDMGNSGRSTGPHLHYEIREDGAPINPMIYIGAGNDVL
ncbi:M23 family metallopeptidase [Rubellimicrobium roseum]|uniref:M23 family peptidase n=1 Tax=Rubellimicrobium roseum TaxID=687525 RepID=A0A5C4NBR9_9RHOB|nr:M23 family metallopeptidase [Rubellimicrobium roseum]TNC71380.1 M23 family peptidase [Rubellimicrobium roseum]